MVLNYFDSDQMYDVDKIVEFIKFDVLYIQIYIFFLFIKDFLWILELFLY